MKRIFSVYCRVELTDQPHWLSEFRNKYDKPYDFHLTLKQAAVIEIEQLGAIKARISTILDEAAIPQHVLRLTFSKLVLDEHDAYDNNGYIYLFCRERNAALDTLQHQIRASLRNFSNYLDPASREYEDKFDPHITIARELSSEDFEDAKKSLPSHVECKGEVREIVVSCVSEITPAQSADPSNLTIYKL